MHLLPCGLAIFLQWKVEYHVTNALACLYMKCDAVLGRFHPDPMILQYEELRNNLHCQKCMEHVDAF